MRFLRRHAVSALYALSACSSVQISSRSGVTAPAKPASCSLPFLRAAPSDRPFDELAALHYAGHVNMGGDPAAVEDDLRAKGCELGADALIVVREFVPGVAGANGRPPMMSVTAVRYRTQ